MDEISVRDAVKLTQFTRQHIYNLIVAERLRARKEGHEYRIERRALAEYINKSKRRNVRS